jgi:hypothetical protein
MVALIKLRHDLGRMTLDELRQLRVDLRKAPDVGNNNKLVEAMISEAEIKLIPNDPGPFFDGVLQVARFDSSLQKSLTEWATKDPGAAIAWFQSKTEASDFQDGSYESRQNRAKVLAGLLQGIAATNLDLAVELFSKETGRHEREEAGNVLIPLAMKRAVEQGDEGFLRTILETAVIEGDSFQQGVNNPWYDYTRATGDLEKSVELLKSLENQQNFGLAMSAIISSQNEISFREKADWLRGQVSDSEERLQALAFPIRSQLFDGSEVPYQETLEATIAQPPGNARDIELLALVQVFKSYSKTEDARRSATEISDPGLRERADEVLTYDPDPFFAPASE